MSNLSGPAEDQTPPTALRVGHGYDVHPFDPTGERSLVLGGVAVPAARGLSGETDADVVCHAITDALLGAAGFGDTGRYLSRTSPKRWSSSGERLAHVVDELGHDGWWILNIDCTIVCESPTLAEYEEQMMTKLRQVTRAQVNVKARHAEGLGAMGRGEGVACHAVVLAAKR